MLLFSFIVLLYWVITELFTLLFRLTGLPDERARFQVTSLLTGCGYTTKESEMFLSSRPRRRLARVTMLFGYVFNITVVTALINVFLSLQDSQLGSFFLGVPIPLAAAAVILIFMRVPKVRAWGDKQLNRLADRLVQRAETWNTVLLMDYLGEETIAQVTLKHIPEEYLGVTLSEMKLRENTGILVMLVEHQGSKAEPAGADTVFAVGDKLTVFGDYAAICRTFHAKESFDELLEQQG
jgi:hypothetical protein